MKAVSTVEVVSVTEDVEAVRGLALAPDELFGQSPVGRCAQTVGFIFHDGFAVAWRFSESNSARNNRLKNDLAEMFLHFANDLLGKVVSHEHGHEDAADVQAWIGARIPNLTHNRVNF